MPWSAADSEGPAFTRFDDEPCGRVEEVEERRVERQFDLLACGDRSACVEHSGEEGALVAGLRLLRGANSVGAYARRVDGEDHVRLRSEIFDDVRLHPYARQSVGRARAV